MSEANWYVVHTYSGYEKSVKSDLEHRIETMGMQDRIFDIEIPMESVTEIKEGGKREVVLVKPSGTEERREKASSEKDVPGIRSDPYGDER